MADPQLKHPAMGALLKLLKDEACDYCGRTPAQMTTRPNCSCEPLRKAWNAALDELQGVEPPGYCGTFYTREEGPDPCDR